MNNKKTTRFQGNSSRIIPCLIVFVVASMILRLTAPLNAQERNADSSLAKIEEKVARLFKDADIPGMSVIIIKDRQQWIKNFGWADLSQKTPVTPGTLFELGSCSKSFTALGVLLLEKKGLIALYNPVSKYLPWFYVTYQGKRHPITLRQLLHHTSGIPWSTLSRIPPGDSNDALQQAVKNIRGIPLDHKPGEQFQYATINYDIIGAVMEAVTGSSFEDFMEKQVFQPLGLTNTGIGVPKGHLPMASGYKIGFFSPRPYRAPVYRGNNPAGYVISNAHDMARWLKLQIGIIETPWKDMFQKTRQRDRTVPPNRYTLGSYAMGWEVSLNGDEKIFHDGQNPNYSAYAAFNINRQIGAVVLANSDSPYTTFIGETIMELLAGNEPGAYPPGPGLDKSASVISIIVGIYLLCVLVFWVFMGIDLVKARRQWKPFSWAKIGKLTGTTLAFLPFLLGIYILPRAMADFSWESAWVWSPISFHAAVILLLTAMAATYINCVFSLFFPQTNEYKKSIPMLILLSLLSGGANGVVIFLIAGSIYSEFELFYILYYFVLAFFVYILGTKVIQTKLIKITYDIVYDLRMKLIEKIFYTSYQKFEKLDRGRVYATLNDDTDRIGNAATVIVQLITGIITVTVGFTYLATISFWTTAVTLAVVLVIAVVYYVVSQSAQGDFEAVRDTRNVYMRLLNGLLDGFKELSLHFNKKREFKNDLEKICSEYRSKSRTALTKFVNAFIIGESFIIVVLGAVSFAIPKLLPGISAITIMSFIMVLLYLIGPFTYIFNSLPALMQIKVSWNRIKQFTNDVPANIDPEKLTTLESKKSIKVVEHLKAENLFFEYKNQNETKTANDNQTFTLGPIDLDIKKGEITFIIGGNGSGKTTLAKLLTGLYIPDNGTIQIDGQPVDNYQLGEYFSTVFSDYHLFEKLYNVDLTDKADTIENCLQMLQLDNKVSIIKNTFSTIDLSGGQRKRLALMQCYLEDFPIYLFDEIAADQDPEFRKFFYRDLLLRMKREGKIVIAITHDDHYFEVADRVIKMDMGKIEHIEKGTCYKVTT